MRPTQLLVLFASTCVACSVDRLPPPAAPARDLPPQEEPLPSESGGLSRVVITTDVPARVERFTHVETSAYAASSSRVRTVGRELLCAETPCTVSLPYGDHELLFRGLADHQRTSTTHISIRRASTVVNHALGQQRGNPVRVLGGIVVVTGLVLLTVAASLAVDANKRHRPTPEATAPLFASGVGSLFVGGVVMAIAPTKIQDGATTQWTPTPPISGATLSAGVRF